METEYDEIVKNLNKKVSMLYKTETTIDNLIPAYNINTTAIYYGLVPVLTYMSLYLIKPKFAMITETGFDGQIYLDNKISHKKLLIATLIVTLLIWISYFAYQYKQKNH